MNAQPKPGWLLIANSVVVICVCVLATSVPLSLVFVLWWDPCSFPGALMVAPIPVVIALQQYRGTFRRRAGAAGAVAFVLLVGGGAAVLLTAAGVGVLLATDGSFDPVLFSVLGVLFAIATYGVFCGWLNCRWWRVLRQAQSRAAQPGVAAAEETGAQAAQRRGLGRFQFSTLELLLCVAAIAAVTGMTTFLVKSAPPQFAEHVTPAEAPAGVPDGASDVSYCRGSRSCLAYEFTIGEEGFFEWASGYIESHESGPPRAAIKQIEREFLIGRCYALSTRFHGPPRATIARGYYYCWSSGDAGVHLAYDLDQHRAYYYYHSY